MIASKGELQGLLHDMEGLFRDLSPWLAGQYDEVSGGFYYARSSRLRQGRKPDIESTAQALNMLERLGLLALMPAQVRRKWIQFFQSRQEPSGYFYDADPDMREDEVMVARAVGYSANALRKLGGEPIYPLPHLEEHSPPYMRSPLRYLDWLRGMDLSNSWRGCDRLACSSNNVKQLKEPIRNHFVQMALRFFEDIQDKDSGLWGEGSLYVRISGSFKLHTFYNRFETDMPRTEQMYASLLQALRSEKASDMCYIRNPIHLLSYTKPMMTKEELLLIVQTTLYNMSMLLRSDGGFSRELAHSPSAPNVAQVKDGEFYPDMPKPVHLSEGKVEGDMNAASQALLIRSLCYQIIGAEAPSLWCNAF